MIVSIAVAAFGAATYGGAWLWAAVGDGAGGANIGAGILGLLGLAVAVVGLLAFVVTGVLAIMGAYHARTSIRSK